MHTSFVIFKNQNALHHAWATAKTFCFFKVPVFSKHNAVYFMFVLLFNASTHVFAWVSCFITKPTALSALAGIKELGPGSFKVEHPEKGKPIAVMSDNNCQAEKFLPDDVHEGGSCKEKNPLAQTQVNQILKKLV